MTEKPPLEFTLSVRPIGKGRPRFAKSGRVYTPHETVTAETEIRWLLKKSNPTCLEGPVALHIKAFFLKPKSAPKKRLYPTVKPDSDNIGKIVTDAANGVLYKDDSQICELLITKAYDDWERIELRLWEIA